MWSLWELLAGRFGLEVMLVSSKVDNEALEALRTRTQVDIEDER